MTFRFLVIISLVLSSIISYGSTAGQGDLFINSKNLLIDKKANKGIFTGGVELYFDDLVLTTETIIVHYKDNDSSSEKIEKIEIPGKFRSIKKTSDQVILADSGVYLVKYNKLVLTGNVQMVSKNDTMKTNRLEYITKLNSIKGKD